MGHIENGPQVFKNIGKVTCESTQGHALTIPEHYRMAARGKGSESRKQRKRKDLPAQIEMAVGMKVLVTNNLETDLNITNGA